MSIIFLENTYRFAIVGHIYYMEFIDLKTIYTILHIFGAVLGAGGAFTSDAMFFSSMKDRMVTKTELRFLKLGSVMVWGGLILLLISGALLFSTDPAGYLASSKFLVKMTIVLIIILNGIFFHYNHIPRISRHVDTHLPSSDEFVRESPLLVFSGAISFVSWSATIILGVLRGIPYSYIEGMLFYVIAVAVAGIVAISVREHVLFR